MSKAVTQTDKLFGNRVRQIREMLGWKQEEIGEKVGLTRTSINNLEFGRQGQIALNLVEKFASAFGMSPIKLMKGIWL